MQEAIVCVIVACAAWVVAQRYGPAPVRRALSGVRANLARRFGMKEKAVQGSCGGCDGCGSARAQTPNAITPEQLKKTIPRH